MSEGTERRPRDKDEGGPRDVAPSNATMLIVRHTEVHNPDAVLYGRLAGFDLSESGRLHADRIAVSLADCPITEMVSSPLLRARRVATIIASRHPAITVRTSSLLTEVGSSWQGRPFRDFPPAFSTYENRREPGDETMEQIRDRMLGFVRRTGRNHPGGTIVAVSHGDPITILRIALLGRPLTYAALRGSDYAALGSITRVVVGSDGHPLSTDVLDQVT